MRARGPDSDRLFHGRPEPCSLRIFAKLDDLLLGLSLCQSASQIENERQLPAFPSRINLTPIGQPRQPVKSVIAHDSVSPSSSYPEHRLDIGFLEIRRHTDRT